MARRAGHVSLVDGRLSPTGVSPADHDSTNHSLSELELEHLPHSTLEGNELTDEPRGAEFSLPPTDKGKDAWLALMGCFFTEMFVWGLPYTYGVFQEYYSSSPEFANDRANITIIGTVASGLMYLGSPIFLLSLRQWPQYRRTCAAIGLVIGVVSLLAASFATTVWQLILTQGVLYAIGGSMLYYPAFLFVDEWWIRKKGFAFGAAWAGTAFSGIALPFFISWCLREYSFRTTLRIIAVAYAVAVTPVLAFALKPRLPISAISVTSFPSIRFAWRQPFLSFQIGSVLESLGYFLPGLFLPSYARYVGFSSMIATLTVVLLNIGNFFGSLLIGFLVDRWHITNVLLLPAVGATFSVTLLWGFSASEGLLCLFALLYGFFAGSFSSTWPGVVQETMRQNRRVESGLAYSLLVSGRGIGNVASGPLSDALLKAMPLAEGFSYGYGSKYGLLILFAGMCNAMGSIGFVARKVGWV